MVGHVEILQGDQGVDVSESQDYKDVSQQIRRLEGGDGLHISSKLTRKFALIAPRSYVGLPLHQIPVCVCVVCVCVCERERERECVCVCVCVSFLRIDSTEVTYCCAQ